MGRGVLYPHQQRAIVRLDRLAPCDELSPYVEFYWHVRWDTAEPYETKVLSHPNVHLVFEEPVPMVYGVDRDLFTRVLRGRGQVLGVKFRPGFFRAFARRPVIDLADRRIAAAEFFGPDVEKVNQAVLTETTPDLAPNTGPRAADTPPATGSPRTGGTAHATGPTENGKAPSGPSRTADTITDEPNPADKADAPAGTRAMVRHVEEFLVPLLPAAPDPAAEEVAAMVGRIVADPALFRVGDAAAMLNVSTRTLQRLFAEYVGASPKWVLRRARLQEAAARADQGADIDWARLADDLGYYDQAHLTRDFTAVVGTSPARYARSRSTAPPKPPTASPAAPPVTPSHT